MLPDRVSNPGPLTYESGALPIALRGPAGTFGFLAVLIIYVHLLKEENNNINDVSTPFQKYKGGFLRRHILHVTCTMQHLFAITYCT